MQKGSVTHFACSNRATFTHTPTCVWPTCFRLVYCAVRARWEALLICAALSTGLKRSQARYQRVTVNQPIPLQITALLPILVLVSTSGGCPNPHCMGKFLFPSKIIDTAPLASRLLCATLKTLIIQSVSTVIR